MDVLDKGRKTGAEKRLVDVVTEDVEKAAGTQTAEDRVKRRQMICCGTRKGRNGEKKMQNGITCRLRI